MGYCPYADRGGARLYLPVPLTSRQLKVDGRLSKAEAPLEDGVLATALIQGATHLNIAGLISIGNPQNANDQIDTYGDVLMRISSMVQFFLTNSALPFRLVISETGTKVGTFEFPPISVDQIYSRCIALTLGFTFSNTEPYTARYSLNVLCVKKDAL